MLIEYVEEALRRARYELIDDEEPYYCLLYTSDAADE